MRLVKLNWNNVGKEGELDTDLVTPIEAIKANIQNKFKKIIITIMFGRRSTQVLELESKA